MSAASNPLFPGKAFIGTVLEVLETKTAMSGEVRRRYLQRAAMAGILIGLLYVTNYALIATFDSVSFDGESLRSLGKVVGAATFGWALVFIYYSKSELLTSNMMIVAIGGYHRRIGFWRANRLLALCFLGNFLGGALVAVLIRFSTIIEGPVLAEMSAAAHHKMEFLTEGAAGWGDLLVRAILCNFLINLAMLLVYNGRIQEDITKMIVMLVGIFIFVFLGFEHSVANTVLFSVVGLWENLDWGLASGNVILALIGNYIGGGLLIGIYYAYVNDDAKYLRTRNKKVSQAN